MDMIYEKFNKNDFGITKTALDVNPHLTKNREECVCLLQYFGIVGNLIYLISCMRLDIAYEVSRLSRYVSNPSTEHWMTIVRVLRCLRYT